MLIGSDGHVKLTDFGLSEAGLRKMIRGTPGKIHEYDPIEPTTRGSSRVINPKNGESELERDIHKHLGV